jgi:hypothetical protein
MRSIDGLPADKPAILVATSSEAIVFAETLSLWLSDVGDPVLWIDGAARSTFTRQLKQEDEIQFEFFVAIFAANEGDSTDLWMVLERYLKTTRPERCFIVTKTGWPIKVPVGVTALTYDWPLEQANIRQFFDDLGAPVKKAILALGSRTAASDSQSVTVVAKKPKPHQSMVFVCYRREDAEDAAGRLHDRLVEAYGAECVFMDIDSVPLGVDFIEHVNERVSQCTAVIVVIGRQWLTVEDKRGRKRLHVDDDLVRAEIAAALTQKVPVIPVVVQNASMPDAEDLPENIRPLARRNGIQLRPDQWKGGVERLLKELNKVMRPE